MKTNILLLLFLVLVGSCRKDFDETTITNDAPEPTIFIESTIQGRVIDESGNPLAGVLVQTVNRSTVTNNNGVFRINQAEVKKSGEIVKASLDGYFLGASHANFSADGTAYTEIQLASRPDFEEVPGSTGKAFTQSNGVQIIIPPSALQLSPGVIYTGNARVYSRWIDPTDANMPGLMPGALVATDGDGNPLALRTYGMLAMEAETESGQTLEIADFKAAEVLLPIPDDLADDAPGSIDLWQYDFDEAEWVLSGSCDKVLVDGKPYYKFDCPKFGYWNCDVAVPSICLTAQVFNPDSTPACYVKIIIEDLTDNFVYWGYTDSLGNFCGSVPQDALLNLTIEDLCENIVYTEEIGPFSEDVQLPDITIFEQVEAASINITGLVSHCITTDVPDGHVAFRYPGKLAVQSFSTGGFDIDLALKCSAFPDLEITVYSAYQNQQTTMYNEPFGGDISLGNILTCEELSDYFYLTIDGTDFWTAPTQFYTETNNEEYLILEGLSGGGNFRLEIDNFNGTGTYTDGIYLQVEDEQGPQFYPELNAIGPSINVEINSVEDDYIEGTIAGTATLNGGGTATVVGNFKIRVAP